MHGSQNIANLHIDCTGCPIRHKAICAQCDGAELRRLDAIKSYHTYRPGDYIVQAGQHVDYLGSIVHGVAHITRTLADGRRQMVGLLLPSDFAGRPGRDIAPYDIVAATEILICRFKRSEFEKLLIEIPSMSSRMLEMVLDELDAARNWMLLLGRKSAKEKIASLFLDLARRDAALQRRGPYNGQSFALHMTRETIADYLGLTIETVSRQISSLRRAGAVSLTDIRTIKILDIDQLVELAADESEDSDGGIIA